MASALLRTIARLAAFGAVVASTAHCGSSAAADSESTDDALSASHVRTLCQDFWSARCGEYIACEPEGFASQFSSQDECVSDKAERCVAEYMSPAFGARAKDIKACFDAYGTIACADFPKFLNEANPEQPAACARLLQGKRADGASCSFDSECSGGSCARSNGTTLCGTCATRHAAGEACTGDTSCAPGLVCKSDGTCGARVATGGACASNGECEPGRWCNAGVCAEPIATGAACTITAGWDDCDWTNGRMCDSTSKTCQVESIHVAGESCGFERAADGVSLHFRGQCGPGLRCAQNAVRGLCLPAAHAGEGCFFSSGPDDSQCDHRSICVDGMCVAKTAQACTGYAPPATPTGPNPGGLPLLTNYGGPTLHHVDLVTVTLAGYPYRDHVRALDEHTIASGWLATVGAEYGITGGTHKASIELTDPLSGTITNENIQDYLVAQIASGALPKPPTFTPDTATFYMLYLPAEVTVSGPPYGTTCKSVYAYHDVVAFPYQFAYGVVATCPVPPPLTWTEEQLLDSSGPHELIEGMTDPDLNMSTAYYAPGASLWSWNGGESSDWCEGNYNDEAGFRMPRSWSNAAALAGTDPCLPLEAGNPAYFNVKSASVVSKVAAGTTATFALTGWSSAPRGDWSLTTKVLADEITVPASAITFDSATINVGKTSTLSIAVPATAKTGQRIILEVNSDDPAMPGIRRHTWIVAVKVT